MEFEEINPPPSKKVKNEAKSNNLYSKGGLKETEIKINKFVIGKKKVHLEYEEEKEDLKEAERI